MVFTLPYLGRILGIMFAFIIERKQNQQAKKKKCCVCDKFPSQDLADAPISRKTNTGRWCDLQLRSLMRKKGIENAFGILVTR